MDEKNPEPAEAPKVKELSLRERVLSVRKRKTLLQAVAAAALLLLVACLAVSFFLGAQTTTTSTTTTTTTTTSTTSTTTTSTTTTTTSTTTTTLSFPRIGDVRIAAYQFKTPYIPENNYLYEEWIVLKNKDTTTVNLTGWKVKNFNYKNTYTIPAFLLAPEASVKIHTGSGMNTETDIYMGRTDEFWNNNVDDISIFDADWKLVDSYYGLARNQHPTI